MAQNSRQPAGQPALDEEGFQRLLAAAHVLQDRNDRLLARAPAKAPANDPTQILAEIVEVQNLVLTSNRDLFASAALIADRTQRITKAAGVAVGFQEESDLTYRAATGLAAGEVGSRVPLAQSLSEECIRTGEFVQYTDARNEAGSKSALFRRKNVSGFIAVPVVHEHQVRAVLELRSPEPCAFPDHDLRTCQLMAGLITEAIAKATEAERKKALATERATMLEALEKIKPQLQRLVSEPESRGEASQQGATVQKEAIGLAGLHTRAPEASLHAPGAEAAEYARDICRGCGRVFEDDEVYCGDCGTARQTEKASTGLQSKWASLWHLQQAAAAGHRTEENDLSGDASPQADHEEHDDGMPPAHWAVAGSLFRDRDPLEEDDRSPGESDLCSTASECSDAFVAVPPASTSLAERPDAAMIPQQAGGPSDLEGPQGLEPLAPTSVEGLALPEAPLTKQEWIRRQWGLHRSRLYLAAAATLFILVLFGWGTRPAQNVAVNPAGARHRRTPPKPQLTFFETILVDLGLAEPPPTPAYLGNPETQVWVDSHTALYYCPGADLFGKTPDGKLLTQREAQQDQFEPAFRRPCD
jgi:hypothetical protein